MGKSLNFEMEGISKLGFEKGENRGGKVGDLEGLCFAARMGSPELALVTFKLWVVGGLTLVGVRGFNAFLAVLVVLPREGGIGGSLEPLLIACLVPLAKGWVLGQVVTGGSPIISCCLPLILT